VKIKIIIPDSVYGADIMPQSHFVSSPSSMRWMHNSARWLPTFGPSPPVGN